MTQMATFNLLKSVNLLYIFNFRFFYFIFIFTNLLRFSINQRLYIYNHVKDSYMRI
jgi:hypothetical protein